QHGDELVNPLAPCFGSFSGLKAIAHCELVLLVERGEKRLCSRVLVECFLEICWDSGPALRVISRVPAAILLSCLNFLQSCAMHSPLLNKGCDLLGVDL